jgi:hypothetical protein
LLPRAVGGRQFHVRAAPTGQEVQDVKDHVVIRFSPRFSQLDPDSFQAPDEFRSRVPLFEPARNHLPHCCHGPGRPQRDFQHLVELRVRTHVNAPYSFFQRSRDRAMPAHL